MNNVKRVNGNYIVDLADKNAHSVTIKGNTFIEGNLVASGNLTYVDSETIRLQDQFIELNLVDFSTEIDPEAAAQAYYGNPPPTAMISGLLVKVRHSETGFTGNFAGLRYNENIEAWQVAQDTSDGLDGSWSTLTTGGAVSGNIFEVQLNDGSGSLTSRDTLKYDWTTGTLNVANTVAVDGSVLLEEQVTPPLAETGVTKVYAQTPGAGESGVYITNDNNTDELITRRKAIVYGLIF